MFENPRRGKQARNFTRNVPKILDLKSSSEQIFSENCRWVPLIYDENFFLGNLYRSNFRELFLDFKGKKLQYELYSEQGAKQEDKGLANITHFQQRAQCSQGRIVQDMISMRTDLNLVANIF